MATFEEAKKKEARYAITSDSDTNKYYGKGCRKKKLSEKMKYTRSTTSDSESTDPVSADERNNERGFSSKNCPSKYFKIDTENVSKENCEKLIEKLCDVSDHERSVICKNNLDATRILGNVCDPERPMTDEIDLNASKFICNEISRPGSAYSPIYNPTDDNNINTPTDSIEDAADTSADMITKNILRTVLKIFAQQKILNDRFVHLEKYVTHNMGLPDSDEKKKLLAELPLQTIESLEEFEKRLRNEESKSVFIRLIAQIGGEDKKNCVRRALKRVFTNTLAMQCSWTGQKNNIQLKKYNMMLYIKEAVRASISITDHEFEHLVMEWFRYAKLRNERGHQ